MQNLVTISNTIRTKKNEMSLMGDAGTADMFGRIQLGQQIGQLHK